MKLSGSIVIFALLALALIASAIFVWPMMQAMAGPDGGLAPAIIMIIGCFVLGGALMFLLFFSARRGHDESVYRSGGDSRRDGEP